MKKEQHNQPLEDRFKQELQILPKDATDKKYSLPSKVSNDAKKIYKIMEVPITTRPAIIK